MSNNHPPLSRKTRKDLANVFVTRYGDTRAEAVKCAKIAIGNLEFPCRFVKSRKNPRRRSRLNYSVHHGWTYPTGLTVDTYHCGQNRKPTYYKEKM